MTCIAEGAEGDLSMDLIDRQAAIDKFEPWLKVRGYSEGELNMLKAVLYELRFLPSAQPEIIRCKDCKWHGYNECFHRLGLIAAFDNNYCSYAERREE